MDKTSALNTSKTLLRALEKAASRTATPQERLEQRISFVYGSMNSNSGVTRERIREIILGQQGAAGANK